MTETVIVCYRPKPGRESDLRDLIRAHVPLLRREGLATEREPWVLRAGDGTYLEIFEWNSAQAVDAAHTNPAVQEMWARFGDACEFETIGNLKEAQEPFSHFEPVDL